MSSCFCSAQTKNVYLSSRVSNI